MEESFKPTSSNPQNVREIHDNEDVAPTKGGTSLDAYDMDRLGKPQVLRRNFGYYSIFGFAMILMSTWEAVLSTSLFGLLNGGTAGAIYMYIITWTGFLLITLSMAEMASIAPTAGGQYHWVSEFAPRSTQKFFSYIIGWLCVLGWQSGTAASAFQTALEIQGLIVLNNSGYVYERWHGTLLTIAVVVFCSLFNTFLAKRLPLVEGIVLILHIVGFVAIIVVLWVLAPRSSAHDVFTQFLDGGNWGNMGLACLVGITSPVLSLLGSDAATHMSEELRDASKNLPKAMVSTLLFNGALGFVMLVTLCFSVGNLEDVLSTPTGFPFIQVFYNATLSKGAATVMTCVLVIMSAFCAVTNLATASRQLFSFARDSGMPFQSWLSHVPENWEIPLNAVIFTCSFSVLFSLINIGSTVAFNQIFSLGLCALLSSYIVSISCMAIKRIRGERLPNSRFKLGKFGLPVNLASIAFLIVAFVFIFFPSATHPIPSTMNWASVIYVGVMAISLLYYIFRARFKYVGPVEYIKKEF